MEASHMGLVTATARRKGQGGGRDRPRAGWAGHILAEKWEGREMPAGSERAVGRGRGAVQGWQWAWCAREGKVISAATRSTESQGGAGSKSPQQCTGTEAPGQQDHGYHLAFRSQAQAPPLPSPLLFSALSQIFSSFSL